MKKPIFIFALMFSVILIAGCAKKHIPYDQIDFDAIEIDETNSDYLCLKDASFFTDGYVGVAAEMPKEIYAFGRLVRYRNALDYFYKLEQEASNQGILYALCGLYYLDYDNYPFLMEKYGSYEDTVTMMFGCIQYEWRFNDVIKIDGAVRLNNNKDTVDKWLLRNPTDDYMLDFYGGGFPNSVMELANKHFSFLKFIFGS